MKKLFFLTLFALAGLGHALDATTSFSKSLSAVDSAITLDVRGYNSASFQLTGTWNATVKFEGTVNGTTWTTVYSVNQKGGAVDSIATANGVYLLSGNGFRSLRARVSARTSGTVAIQTLANEGSGVVSLLNQTSAGAATNVAVTTSALPTGAATSTKQSDGTQKTQVVDGSGNVIGATSNALDVNIKSGASSGAVAQGSTTSGQTGSLTQAAVTTAAPSYTTGQTSPLSLTTGGALRVDASAQTLTVGSHAVTNAGTFATQAAQSGTWTVQPGNTANTTAWKVDGSAVTQPISAASLPLPSTAATSTKQSDGTQKTQIVDGSGNVIASTSNNLNVQCANCSGSGASATDAATFTASSSVMAPSGAFYQTTATANALTSGQQGMLQSTAQRALFVNLRDASGNEVSVGGGTQYAEDVASADGQIGTIAMAIRKATPANQSGTDGDLEPLQVAAGRLWVDASGKTLTVDGSGVTQPVSLASVPSHAVTNAGTFATQATLAAGATTAPKAEDVAAADADVGMPAYAVRKATPANQSGSDGDYEPMQISAGRLWVDASGKTLTVDGSGVTQPVSGTVTATIAAAATTIAKAEDVANADADVGTPAMMVRKATPANISGTDGDYEFLQGSAGRLWVDASGKTLTVDGSGVTQPVSLASVPSHAVTNAGTFATQATIAAGATNIAKAEDVASADADVGVPAMAIRQSSPANTSGANGDWEALQMSAGRLWTSATVDAALPTGSNTIGNVNPGTAANWAVGATGSAVPANAQLMGANSAGNLTAVIQANASVKIDMTTATTTQLVALASSQKIYITSWDVIAGGTGTFKLVYGTGSNCGTGTTDVTGAYDLIANSGISKGGGLGPVLVVPASQALCATSSAAVNMKGSVAYTQF